MESSNSSIINIISSAYDKVKAKINREQTFEEFCKFLETNYHKKGHEGIAKACSSTFNPINKNGKGPMAFTETSARDPIFWRWHSHIEEIIQTFRDTQLPL